MVDVIWISEEEFEMDDGLQRYPGEIPFVKKETADKLARALEFYSKLNYVGVSNKAKQALKEYRGESNG